MEYRYRFLSKKITSYLNHFPVIVLTGSRQVGKTTLLSRLLSDTHELLVFDPVIDVENARQEPELFFKNHPGPVVLDEIQYSPELIPVIKRLADREKTAGKYVLTGSQQWGVLKNVAESLAGRAVILNLMGYNLSECADTAYERVWINNLLDSGRVDTATSSPLHLPFPIGEHIFRGQLPGIQELPLEMVPDYLESYIATYIERDLRQLADVADLHRFNAFYRLCGALSAQEINHSQIGRQIDVAPQTAKRWLDILKSTFQWIEIPAYSGNTVKRISGKPKGFMSDTGLLARSNYLSTPRALPSHPAWGAMVETLVVLDILKSLSFRASQAGVYHWRTHNGAEVDLLLEENGRFFPIEIKATARPTNKDTRGIRAFRESYPHLDIGPGVVIHLGDSNLWLSKEDIALSYFTL